MTGDFIQSSESSHERRKEAESVGGQRLSCFPASPSSHSHFEENGVFAEKDDFRILIVSDAAFPCLPSFL